MANIVGLDGKPLKQPTAQIVTVTSDKGIEVTVNYNEPDHQVFCLNNIENGKIVGSCIYSDQFTANTIAAAMNQEYAKLNVKMEARVVSLPVYSRIIK